MPKLSLLLRRSAIVLICLFAVVGIMMAIEKCVMAHHMVWKFGYDARIPVLFNPSTFWTFTALAVAGLSMAVAMLVRSKTRHPRWESLALKSAMVAYGSVFAILGLLLALGLATLN